MSKHRNPQARLSKQAPLTTSTQVSQIERLYRELVEVEALAIAADEAVTMLPPYPSGKHKRILARLFTLVTKTADQASQALEKARTCSPSSPPTWRPEPPSSSRGSVGRHDRC